ncbi:MAG: hypothetical protein ABSH56_08220 [Bryobacteraceae bacterium]
MALAFALLLSLAASAAIIDRIAVSVGNRVVTTLDVDREIRVTAFLDGRKPDFGKDSKKATADRLVDQQLIRSELEYSRYPAPSAAEIAPLLDEFKSKYFASDAARCWTSSRASTSHPTRLIARRWPMQVLQNRP